MFEEKKIEYGGAELNRYKTHKKCGFMAKNGRFVKHRIYLTLEILIIERHWDSNVVSIGFCSSFDSPFRGEKSLGLESPVKEG